MHFDFFDHSEISFYNGQVFTAWMKVEKYIISSSSQLIFLKFNNLIVLFLIYVYI